MTRQIFNIFPTTIYVSEIPNHKKYKDTFYKLYPKYDYEQVTYQDGEEWLIQRVKIQGIHLYI